MLIDYAYERQEEFRILFMLARLESMMYAYYCLKLCKCPSCIRTDSVKYYQAFINLKVANYFLSRSRSHDSVVLPGQRRYQQDLDIIYKSANRSIKALLQATVITILLIITLLLHDVNRYTSSHSFANLSSVPQISKKIPQDHAEG